MSPPLACNVMVQEQLGLALNRAGQGEEAERVLQQVLDAQGPSSETYGILGRVYKDRWEAALEAGETFLADGLLDNAIDAYLKGSEADVTYAVERRIAAGKPDYWDFATQLELAVLGKDKAAASAALRRALAAVRETWEPETTARNLCLIREARERRGDAQPWATEVEQALQAVFSSRALLPPGDSR
jgi:tetratricopeptide (TPR) repeat protein